MFSRGNKNLLAAFLFVSIIASNTFPYYEWRPLGAGNFNGTNGHVYAIVPFNGKIIVAGGFSNAGGVNVNNLAQWDPMTYIWSPLGAGLNDTVYSVYVYNSQLYAAGSFSLSGSTPVSRIAVWTGTAWQSLGSGLDGEGYAMCQFGTELVVGRRGFCEQYCQMEWFSVERSSRRRYRKRRQSLCINCV
jgi:hypothetical protein